MLSTEFFQLMEKKVVVTGTSFTIKSLDYTRYREFCRELVFDALVNAPFEITRENVNRLKDTILFQLVGHVVNLTVQNMGSLGKVEWVKKHKNVLSI